MEYTPAERIEAIRRIEERLAQHEWSDIDLVLEQFGFRETSAWSEPKKSQIRRTVKDGTSSSLRQLDEYLGTTEERAVRDWNESRLSLFLSHVAVERIAANELKLGLWNWGMDVFVAHEDISPGAEWQAEILAALRSCEALVAMVHAGFKESDWCSQEVGFALGRDVPVVPVRYGDLVPFGFFGAIQALNGGAIASRIVAAEVAAILLDNQRTHRRMVEAIVTQLFNATSFRQANELSSALVSRSEVLSHTQLRDLRAAKVLNSQLSDAWSFEANLLSLEKLGGLQDSSWLEDTATS